MVAIIQQEVSVLSVICNFYFSSSEDMIFSTHLYTFDLLQ